MFDREPVWRTIRRGMGHWTWLGWLTLGMAVMFLATRWNTPLHVDSISIAYPYEERSLVVERSGYVQLARGGAETELPHRSFDVDDLFQLLMAYWEPLREGEPAVQDMGTVRVFYSNHTSGTYFVYDTGYLEELFAEAQANVAGEP